jgi:hypothetical protein
MQIIRNCALKKNENSNNRIFGLISIIILSIILLAGLYIALNVEHLDLYKKRSYFLLFWGGCFIIIYITYILYNLVAHGRFHGINNKEKILQRNVLLLGLVIYFWSLEVLALLIEKITFFNQYERFCFWYILLIMYSPILFLACERFYYLKISAYRGYKLWKVYIPKNLLSNKPSFIKHETPICTFVIEEIDEHGAIQFALDQFGNDNVKLDKAQYESQIKCQPYQGFNYTPNGQPSCIGFA